MARFELQMPDQILKDIKKIYDNSEEIFGAMTTAGAEVVAKNMKNNAPEILKPYVKISRVYKTPSNKGINTKAYISGYVPFSNPNRKSFSRGGGGENNSTSEGVPAPFLGIMYEYGRSTAPFPKHPFLRKSFKKGDIEAAMLKAQKEASGGLLDE